MDPVVTVLASEGAGTAVLLLLGVGVSANATLTDTFGRGGGYLMVALGWSLGVFAGVYVAHPSGAHLNPAVTLAITAQSLLPGGPTELAPGIPVSLVTVLAYLVAELGGAFAGAVAAWAVYRPHFDRHPEPRETLGALATAPAVRSGPSNVLGEGVATFVLVLVLLVLARTPTELGPLASALVVLAVGLGLGGTTGWAINPARDLAGRLAHAVLPIAGKGPSDWAYAWVPVVGPVAGGVLGGLAAHALGAVGG
ncbi:MIP/aquaporin family protein [Sanguibacter suaedae]|uniref:Aquaporin family protein n=1 Tax=Sanguibacter suaedae TaxID=2795737 RepID=A0A934M673_9MICO|nr:MIP/aquaporin family protein [Sanguibacter suaedae]MBI9113937.1 aquaporin family protein [Sanguibacter suaedae]